MWNITSNLNNFTLKASFCVNFKTILWQSYVNFVSKCLYEICFLAAQAALSLHMGQTDWVTHDYQFERSTLQCASGLITSNILTQASWRLYEIRQPPTSLQMRWSSWLIWPSWSSWSLWLPRSSWSPMSSWLTGLHGRHGHHARHGYDYHCSHACHGHQDRQENQDNQDKRERQDIKGRQIWHLNLTFQITCVGQLSQFFRCLV